MRKPFAIEHKRSYDYAIAQRDAIESAITQQQAEEQAATRQKVAVAQIAQSAAEAVGSYVNGTCKDLKASGVGSDFTPGDANYTSARDRDNDGIANDGIACES